MGRSQQSRNKKEIQSRKEKNRKEKEKKRLERKDSARNGNNLDEMIAYVDEFGNITSTPPDLSQRVAINAEDIEISIPRKSDDEEPESRHTGIVSFFNDSKGFGFIRDLQTQESIFVHIKELHEPVKENDKVSFMVTKSPKGLSAVDVTLEK